MKCWKDRDNLKLNMCIYTRNQFIYDALYRTLSRQRPTDYRIKYANNKYIISLLCVTILALYYLNNPI